LKQKFEYGFGKLPFLGAGGITLKDHAIERLTIFMVGQYSGHAMRGYCDEKLWNHARQYKFTSKFTHNKIWDQLDTKLNAIGR
jgi:hypothetical protein